MRHPHRAATRLHWFNLASNFIRRLPPLKLGRHMSGCHWLRPPQYRRQLHITCHHQNSHIHTTTTFGLGDFVIPNADPATFDVAVLSEGTSTLPTNYARDSSHVFIYATMIVGADVASFSILLFGDDAFVESPYSKDKNFVYYTGVIPTAATSTPAALASIPGADPNSFAALYDVPQEGGDDTYAKDRNYVYLGDGVIPGADPTTFKHPTSN